MCMFYLFVLVREGEGGWGGEASIEREVDRAPTQGSLQAPDVSLTPMAYKWNSQSNPKCLEYHFFLSAGLQLLYNHSNKQQFLVKVCCLVHVFSLQLTSELLKNIRYAAVQTTPHHELLKQCLLMTFITAKQIRFANFSPHSTHFEPKYLLLGIPSGTEGEFNC